ncbi:MAG: NHL repeat containing protein, partial [uncultured bacterium]
GVLPTNGVAFNGTIASTYSVVNDTQITATVPSGASTGPIVVTHPTNGASNGMTFTVTNPPSITNLNPTSGLVGASVVITGTNFNGTSVTFNGTAATFTVDSPTQITATIPSGATTGNVVVTTTAGTSNGWAFTVTVAPSWTFAWRKTGLNGPRNACFDTNNVICIANSGANNVARFDTNGTQLANITDGSFNGVVSIAVDSSGNHYVACYNTKKIQRFDSNWTNRVELISTTYDIRDIAAEYGSSIAILESQGGVDGKVEVFNSAGTLIYGPWNIASANTPLSIALSSDGNYVWIADSSTHYVRKYSLAGALQGSYGGSGSGNGQFSYPDSIHVDSSSKIYIGDSGNFRFQVFDSNMTFLGKFTGTSGTGNGQFNTIIGIVSDTIGNVYTTDDTGNNIQKFTKN